MIRLPGHLVNSPPPFTASDNGAATTDVADAAAVLTAAGADIDAVTARVAAAGGDTAMFHAALAASARAVGTVTAGGAGSGSGGSAREPVADRVADLVAVAAWRSGAVPLRDDALARLRRLAADPAGRQVAAAALALDDAGLDEFVARQSADRFWFPGRAALRGYVLSTGGFRGLGGVWIRPPEEAVPLAEAGAFAIRSDDQWWRLDCDVFGSRLRLQTARPDAGPSGSARIILPPASHLAWVYVAGDA